MKKIISLFARNYDGDHLVRNEVVPGAEWVLAGEGLATRKFDGTCCMVRDGILYKRYDAKAGREPPAGFESAQDADPVTGHWPGWIPVGEDSADKYHREALENWELNGSGFPVDGTYELCGPKIQGNPEGCQRHLLVPHGAQFFRDAPRTFEELKEWFRDFPHEGIVWHHPDGRMVKIKRRDFGFKRGAA